jgi:exodeoxyribonuclease VII small subunit
MAKTAKDPSPPSFEEALRELEVIVQNMETGQLSLEQSLASYQRGVDLLRHCQGTLSAAEQKIQLLEGNKLSDFSDPASA